MQISIFHVDMDAFYASVEQVFNPNLRNKPIIVGGHLTNRGVVSACSYEARKYGVHSAMPIFQAKKLCPHGVYVPVDMKKYQKVSKQIMKILQSFSPEVQQISVDEAFLDMSGTEKIFGSPLMAAEKIKEKVFRETGLTISVGIASSKFLAKMASDFKKPDGLYQIHPGCEEAFIDNFTIGQLWGIGDKTAEKIQKMGFTSVQKLRAFPLNQLEHLFGTNLGSYLYKVVRGQDPGIFSINPNSRSISNETTFAFDVSQSDILNQYLLELSHHVVFRSFTEGVQSKTPFVKYKTNDFRSFTARETLRKPIISAEELFSHVKNLFYHRWDKQTPLRLIGVGLQNIEDKKLGYQMELFDDPFQKKRAVEETVYKIKKRGLQVSKASSLLNDFEKKLK